MSEYRSNPQPNQPAQQFQPPRQQQWQSPPQSPPQTPKPPEWWRKYKHWIMYPVVAVLAVAIGTGAAGTPTSSDATATAQPTVTATVTASAQPGQKVTVPGPTKTVSGPVKTVTAPPPAPAGVMSDDGTYLVGTDIKPGTYRAQGGGTCYWARLRNLNGDLDSIITNNLGANPVVTIKRTDKAFETSRCGEWTKIR